MAAPHLHLVRIAAIGNGCYASVVTLWQPPPPGQVHGGAWVVGAALFSASLTLLPPAAAVGRRTVGAAGALLLSVCGLSAVLGMPPLRFALAGALLLIAVVVRHPAHVLAAVASGLASAVFSRTLDAPYLLHCALFAAILAPPATILWMWARNDLDRLHHVYRPVTDRIIVVSLTTLCYVVFTRLFLPGREPGPGVDLAIVISILLFQPALHDRMRRSAVAKAIREGRAQERAALRRELHDGLGSTLASVAMTLDPQAPALRDRVADAHDRLNDALTDLRRLCSGQEPPALDLAEALSRIPHTALTVEGDLSRVRPDIRWAVLRITQEALHNAWRHTGTEQPSVHLSVGSSLRLQIADDGTPAAVSAPGGGTGIASMRTRAEELGGRLSIERAPGGGTRIGVELPL